MRRFSSKVHLYALWLINAPAKFRWELRLRAFPREFIAEGRISRALFLCFSFSFMVFERSDFWPCVGGRGWQGLSPPRCTLAPRRGRSDPPGSGSYLAKSLLERSSCTSSCFQEEVDGLTWRYWNRLELELAAQGGGGVPIPGDVWKTCRCGTSGHGLVAMVVLGGWLDLMVLEVFSSLWFYDWGRALGKRFLTRC